VQELLQGLRTGNPITAQWELIKAKRKQCIGIHEGTAEGVQGLQQLQDEEEWKSLLLRWVKHA
jgi:hypothetical protein